MDARKSLKSRSRADSPVPLRNGERFLIQAQISSGIYWKTVAVFIVAALFGAFIAFELALFLSGVAMLMALFATVIREILMLVVTDQRVVVRVGTILIETIDLRLDKIESVELQRTLIGQILGYSSVIVTGTGSRLALVPFIANGPQVRAVLDDMLYQRDQVSRNNNS